MRWLDIEDDLDVWLEIPPRWTIGATEPWEDDNERTPQEWATETAALWWEEHESDPVAGEVELLADTLAACVEQYPKTFPEFEVLLYLPSPGLRVANSLPKARGSRNCGGLPSQTMMGQSRHRSSKSS
jgi:hypothetical protein